MLRSLAPWDPVLDLVRLGLFLGFLVLGLRASRATLGAMPAAGGRRGVDVFLAYVLALTTAVGLVQRESWPFTNWALVHGMSPRRVASWEIEGIDAAGRGYAIDPRILQPLAPEEFGAWMAGNVSRLGPSGRSDLGRFLLARAEAARLRVLRGGRVGRNEWLLGPLAAPYHFQGPAVWRSSADVPATPFRGLRIWALEWDVLERLAEEGRVTRRVLLEYHDAPPA